MAVPITDYDVEVEVGQVSLPCGTCNQQIPVTILAKVSVDEDGDDAIYCRAETADTWAHQWTHKGLAGEVPDDG